MSTLKRIAVVAALATLTIACGSTVDETEILNVKMLGANLLDSFDDPRAWHQFDSLRHDRPALERGIDSLARICDFHSARWEYVAEKIMTRLDGPDEVTMILEAPLRCGRFRLTMTYQVLDPSPVLGWISLRPTAPSPVP